MRKWILLTIFIVATSLVSIGMNLRNSQPPADQRGIKAMQLMNDHQFAQAVPILEQLAIENKSNPQITAVLQYNIAVCKAQIPHVPAAAFISEPATAPAATQASPLIDPSTGNPRVPHAKPKPGETLVLTIKQLGNFPFDPVTDATVPADVMALDGTRVTLTGFIIPFREADSITEFALQPSLNGCCFGQPAGVQHTIICHAAPEKKLSFIASEVLITGKLTVKPERENDYTHTVFKLEVESFAPSK